MTKHLLILLLLASPMFAQDQAAEARRAAGCGLNDAQFDVKTEKDQHPAAKPESGKALVFVFGNQDEDLSTLHVGGMITRWGVDGTWVGASDRRSYFFFLLDPGDHRLCTSLQSKLKFLTKRSAALSFTAEAGKFYYFRTKTPLRQLPDDVDLSPVDPAAAQLLIAESAFSVSHAK